ncbi:hypothetical protein C8R45DRAFT_1002254 [Mycena sanguinolenta]|nr:hypothetical protein C8R45DRAFT_1002254 [Mycena sanguinolenta]
MASIDAVSAMVSAAPRFPLELERAIFEIVALSWPRSIPRLMLVAWRIKSWVEPLLYRTIIVSSSLNRFGRGHAKDTGTLLSCITSNQSTFRDSVRHLYLAHAVLEEVTGILHACSAVENLWVAARTPIVLLDFDLPLKCLHATLDVIFGRSPIDFSHRLLSSLTDLELFDPPVHIDLEVWSALTRLPQLTHLACDNERYLRLSMFLTFLPTWKSLRGLVILLGEWAETAAELLEEDDNFFELTQDPAS